MWGWIAGSAALSAFGTWLARRYALRRRLIDEPGERRSHTVATPRGGGIGPVVACVVAIVAMGLQGRLLGAQWPWIAAALLSVAAVGAWDDHRPLGAGIRLGVHVLAGAALAFAFGLVSDPIAVLSVLVAVAVLVNVWNFMDGINGIASTQAVLVVATGALLMTGPWMLLALVVAAAIAAFVPFNFPKARVFLGDVGSGALGLLIAVVGLALIVMRPGEPAPALLLFPCAAFLVDATMTLGWRVLGGERWWTPHTRHLYQAMARGRGHSHVTLMYAAWSSGGAVLATAIDGRPGSFIMLSLVLWYMAAASIWTYLQYNYKQRSAAA